MTRPTKRRFEESASGEEYLHKDAWTVVRRQIEHADANPCGALYDDLVAMMFAFHCIEGFLNFVGDKIAPELWKDEKERFKASGIDGKLEEICKLCGLSKPKKGRRPYQTISTLKTLRNQMAHPKTRKTESVKQFEEGKTSPLFQKPYLSTLVSHEKATQARDDVKCIADEIHKAARVKFPDADLGVDALEGILAMRTTGTRLAEPD